MRNVFCHNDVASSALNMFLLVLLAVRYLEQGRTLRMKVFCVIGAITLLSNEECILSQ